MKILIDINHPAQVHFFKHFIWAMKKKGHQILITAYNKEVVFKLLKYYQLDYVNMGMYSKSLWKKAFDLLKKDLILLFVARKFKPDLFMGLGSINAAHIAWLTRKASIIFDDDEYSYPFYHFFARQIIGFSGFKIRGPKIRKVAGFKELAYLHPDVFRPDRSILKEIGVGNKPYFIIRLVAWQSGHDVGRNGLNLEWVSRLIEILEKRGKVLISSEKELPGSLSQYGIKIKPERLHDALFYAQMLICDSQTMATEAAVLGTPVVRCNSFAGSGDMGNFIELEKKYNLMYSFRDPKKALNKVLSLLDQANLKEVWRERGKKLFHDKINVTQMMVDSVEQLKISKAR